MKLDENEIEKLIEEVLQEFQVTVGTEKETAQRLGVFDGPPKNKPKKTAYNKKFFAKLAKVGGKPGSIDSKDLEAAFKKKYANDAQRTFAKTTSQIGVDTDNNTVAAAVKSAYEKKIAPSGTDKIDKDGDGTPDEIEKNVGDLETGLISDPRTYNIGAAPGKDARGNYPQATFPSAVQDTMGSLLSDAPSLRERLQRLNEYSTAMVNGDMQALKSLVGIGGGATADADSKRQLLNACLAVDYIAAIAKNMDNQSASYIFESFLALICGGRQSGGDNKAGDFVMSDGSAGSAKYYKSKTGSTQAVSGFVEDTKVTYVHAVKAAAGGGKNTDPKQLTSVDLYLYDITFTSLGRVDFNDTEKSGTKKQALAKLSKADYPQFTTNNANAVISPSTHAKKDQYIYSVTFSIPEGKQPDATIFLAKDKNDTFLSSLENTLSKDADLQETFNDMKDFFKQTVEADKSIRRYIAAKDSNQAIAQGNAALNSMDSADSKLQNILTKVGAGAGKQVKGTKGARKLTESKFADLDKLILEVLKENT